MIQEINLVCMSGQGSVQAMELLSKAYFMQHGYFVKSQVFPGPRARSAPVVSYVKVSDRPINSISANYNPGEVLVFWDGLFRVAAHDAHAVVADAIGRLRSGLFLVNSPMPPEEIELPFAFGGTVATVDADRIVTKYLRRDPPPVGTALVGAYAAITGKLHLGLLEELIRERFPGNNGKRNAEATREAFHSVLVARDYRSRSSRTVAETDPIDPDSLPEHFPIAKGTMRGYTQGGANILRAKIPVCDDDRCLCQSICLSEAMCPDNTGFIARWIAPDGRKRQGYRIDVDYCRGCGTCAEVCPYGAIKRVPEREVLAANPTYEGITVAPFWKRGM